MPSLPFVSVVCPLFERPEFVPIILRQFQNQDYEGPMELVILDDSSEPFPDLDLFEADKRVRYCHEERWMKIPTKRNRLNELAKGEIIVSFDSDDVIMPERVSHSVEKLIDSEFLIAGNSMMYVYDTKRKAVFRAGPLGAYHATNNTFAVKRKYLENHSYEADAEKNFGEESAFTNHFTEPMVQLHSMSTVVCVNHGSNVIDKEFLLKEEARTMVDLGELIEDQQVRDFFLSL